MQHQMTEVENARPKMWKRKAGHQSRTDNVLGYSAVELCVTMSNMSCEMCLLAYLLTYLRSL